MAYWDFIPGFPYSEQDDEFCALISRNYRLIDLIRMEEIAHGLGAE